MSEHRVDVIRNECLDIAFRDPANVAGVAEWNMFEPSHGTRLVLHVVDHGQGVVDVASSMPPLDLGDDTIEAPQRSVLVVGIITAGERSTRVVEGRDLLPVWRVRRRDGKNLIDSIKFSRLVHQVAEASATIFRKSQNGPQVVERNRVDSQTL